MDHTNDASRKFLNMISENHAEKYAKNLELDRSLAIFPIFTHLLAFFKGNS
jgi:hypothetical protein